jgi:UDPglucose 6-dehydrogenase
VISDFRTSRFTERVHNLARRSSVKKVTVLGYAYKRDTGDARDSFAKSNILTLLKEGWSIELRGPLVPQKNIISNLMEDKIDSKLNHDTTFHRTLYDACNRVQVAVIVNDSQQYRDLDWRHISMSMQDKNFFVNGRGVTDEMKLTALGVVVEKYAREGEPERRILYCGLEPTFVLENFLHEQD